jgi:hypothetical protein
MEFRHRVALRARANDSHLRQRRQRPFFGRLQIVRRLAFGRLALLRWFQIVRQLPFPERLTRPLERLEFFAECAALSFDSVTLDVFRPFGTKQPSEFFAFGTSAKRRTP